MNVYKQRILNVARALRESPNPERFNMGRWGGFCGTPGCALGHYAIRRDLQRTFSLSFWTGHLRANGRPIEFSWDWNKIPNHFGISLEEANKLFSGQGCGDAQNTGEAIAYIERFAAKKWPDTDALTELKSNIEKRTIPDGEIESPEYARG